MEAKRTSYFKESDTRTYVYMRKCLRTEQWFTMWLGLGVFDSLTPCMGRDILFATASRQAADPTWTIPSSTRKCLSRVESTATRCWSLFDINRIFFISANSRFSLKQRVLFSRKNMVIDLEFRNDCYRRQEAHFCFGLLWPLASIECRNLCIEL
jgi:hypothetical protein